MKAILMRGISGSGKSTYVKSIMTSKTVVCSTDSYFYNNPGRRPGYDASKLGEAHGECLKKYIEAIRKGECDYLIVDNTNITPLEIASYVQIASAYGIVPEIVMMKCEPDIAANRGIHKVPLELTKANYERLMVSRLPPYWKVTHKEVVGV